MLTKFAEGKLNNQKIDSLYQQYIMSQRAYNICQKYYLLYTEEIANYYIKNKSFTSLKGCGRLTSDELIELSRNYIKSNPDKYESFETVLKVQNNLNFLLSDVDIVRKVEIYLNIRLPFLSKRTKNYILKEDKYITFKDYFEKTIDNFTTLKSKSNIGPKSIKEISFFNDELFNYCKNLQKNPSSAGILQFKYLMKHLFGFNSDRYIEIVIDEVINKKLYLFSFIENVLLKEANFTKEELYILKEYSGVSFFLNSENLTLEEIGNKFSLTRERVRQKKQNAEIKISNYLSLFYLVREFLIYNENFNEDIVLLSDELRDNINFMENTKFTKRFFLVVFKNIYKDKYEFISSNDISGLEEEFLIRKRYCDEIDIISLLKEVSEKTNGFIKETYKIPVIKLIKKYSRIGITQDLKILIKNIISKTFHLKVDSKSNIVLNKTRKHRDDYIVDILEKNGNPMTKMEIYEKYKKIFPTATIASLMGNLINSPKIEYIRGGIATNRLSLYTLKSWRLEKKIKTGALKDIIYEILSKSDLPLNICTLESKLYDMDRMTNSLNIFGNLLQDIKKRFVIYPDFYVGLKDKENSYPKFIQESLSLRFFNILKKLLETEKFTYQGLLEVLTHEYEFNRKKVELVLKREISRKMLIIENNIISVNYGFRQRDVLESGYYNKAFEYLSNKDKPVYMDEITKYINKNANENNFYNSLRFYPEIVFLPMKFVGLFTKKYDQEIPFDTNLPRYFFGTVKKFIIAGCSTVDTLTEKMSEAYGEENKDLIKLLLEKELRKERLCINNGVVTLK